MGWIKSTKTKTKMKTKKKNENVINKLTQYNTQFEIEPPYVVWLRSTILS